MANNDIQNFLINGSDINQQLIIEDKTVDNRR